MSLTMTQADYARRCNVTRAAVNQWKQDGHIVMRGPLVDVKASDAKLARSRRHGLPSIDPIPRAVPRGRPKRGALVELDRDVIATRLARLDWAQTFDWSEIAQYERARQAARCVGWVALESEVRDDGHWGGFQLRYAVDKKQRDEVTLSSVIAGFGFDLSAWAVIDLCREEVAPLDECATATVRPDLLHFLAHPFDEWDRQRITVDEECIDWTGF